MAGRPRKKAKAGYMISAVAELYRLHPQTLRLYERVGLLKPSRSQGNTRLYTDSDLERLEVILNLTRELGVNLAGIEIILNMRDKMGEMQSQMEAFIQFVRGEMARGFAAPDERENSQCDCAIVAAAGDQSGEVGRSPVASAKCSLNSCRRSFHRIDFFHRDECACAEQTRRIFFQAMAERIVLIVRVAAGKLWSGLRRERSRSRRLKGPSRRVVGEPKMVWAVPCDCTKVERLSGACACAHA